MTKALAIALVLILACCSRPEDSRGGARMDRIEQQVRLPNGVRPLSDYARYYAYGRSGEVEARYVVPFSDDVRPGEFCEELTANFTSHPVPCPNTRSQAAELKAGQRRWVADSKHFPVVLDGGCAVISLAFDAKTAKVISAECNGEA